MQIHFLHFFPIQVHLGTQLIPQLSLTENIIPFLFIHQNVLSFYVHSL